MRHPSINPYSTRIKSRPICHLQSPSPKQALPTAAPCPECFRDSGLNKTLKFRWPLKTPLFGKCRAMRKQQLASLFRSHPPA